MNGYWNNKNVFITGANGFIGGNLSAALIARGANVFALIRNRREDSYLFYHNLQKKIVIIDGDLSQLPLIERVISEEGIQVVFHLGAQVEVGVGMTNPFLTFETNVRGTYQLMEAIHRFPESIEAVIVASTDKAYGAYPENKMPYQEDYPLLPQYPYDTSKACADMIAQCYANSVFKRPVVVTRFCNVFGPGQLNFSAIIPDAIRSALGYTTFIPRGDGRQIRDFLFVEDVVGLYLKIAEGLARNPEKLRGQIFNAGTSNPISVKEVIETIYGLVGKTVDLDLILKQMQGKKTKGEIDCQFMDYKKAEKFFEWRPQHSLKQGLEKTIEWYIPYLQKKWSPNSPTSTFATT